MSLVLVIEPGPSGVQAALVEDDRLIEVDVPAGDDAVRDRVFLGRVRTVERTLDAAFVDCGLGTDAWLGARHARRLGSAGRDAPIGRRLEEGRAVIVQGLRSASDGKGPRVTGDVALRGLRTVLRPRRRDVDVSARLGRAGDARAQRARARRLFPEGGVQLRAAAADAADEDLIAEVERLRARWRRIEAEAARARPPALLDAPADPVEQALLGHLSPAIERVVVTERAALARARRFMEAWCPDLADRLACDPEASVTLAIEEQIEAALAPRVALRGGGFLIIEPTAALVAIDVDGAGRPALETDLEAAREVARQVRLRRLGGTIVADFIDLPARRDRERVVSALGDAFARDPVPARIWPMTALGLVQISRRRDGRGLAELLSRPCPSCAGTGVVPSLRHRADALMRAVATSGPARVRVRLAADLHDYVSGEGADVWRAFAERHPWGRIEPDPSLAPGAFRLDPEVTR